MLKGRKRKRKLAVRNGDAVDETVESETGSGSVTTSSDLASPAKVTVLSGICALQLSQTFFFVCEDGQTLPSYLRELLLLHPFYRTLFQDNLGKAVPER